MGLHFFCNRMFVLVIAVCSFGFQAAEAEKAYFSAQIGADMITVAATMGMAEGTPYVSLNEIMGQIKGVVALQPDRIQANYDGTTVVLGANDTSVRMAGSNFSLVHSVRQQGENVFISLIDVPVFFSSAFGLPFSRTTKDDEVEMVELTPLDPEEPPQDILDETNLPPLDDAEDTLDDSESGEEEEPEGETISVEEDEGEIAADQTPTDSPSGLDFDMAAFARVKGTITLDPGHGGQDAGVTAGNKMKESDLTLAIAKRIQDILAEQTEIEVILTRDEDVELPLSNRKAVAEKEKALFFLSLHAGFSATPRAQGVSIFTDEGGHVPEETISEKKREHWKQRQKLAEKAGTYGYRLARALGENSALGNVIARSCPLILQREIEIPVVLVEIAYLSNIDTATLLSEEEYQAQVALNLAWAVASVLNQD